MRFLKKSPYRLYITMFLLSLFVTAIVILVRGGGQPGGLFFRDARYVASDFWNHLHYNDGQTGGPWFAEFDACFPAFAYTFYILLHNFITKGGQMPELLAFMVLTALTAVLFLEAIRMALESGERPDSGERRSATLLTLCFLLSGICLFTIERGNSAFIVMVVLLFACVLRESDRAWQREIALFLIAAAAGFKIYPCIFGLLYIVEKRYREAARLLLYGILFFFLPFCWLGGVDGFVQFLKNQSDVHTHISGCVSVSAICKRFARAYPHYKWFFYRVIPYLRVAVGVALAVAFCLRKQLWARVLYLAAFIAMIPGWSGEYVILYYAVPFVLFLAAHRELQTVREWVYAALFSCIFLLLPFESFAIGETISLNILISIIAMYLVSAYSVLETFVLAIVSRRKEA